MLIYFSMYIWVVFMWGMKALTEKTLNRKFNTVPVAFALLTFGYIIFWVSARTAIGDTTGYIRGFQSVSPNITFEALAADKSPGFTVLQYIVKWFIFDNYHVFFAVVGIISCGSVCRIFIRRSENFYYSMFLFIATLHTLWLMNGIRQYLAACILFAFSEWILNRKRWIPYLLIILLAYTIHNSCIVLVPAMFIAVLKPWGKAMWACVITFVLVLVFAGPLFDRFLDSSQEYAGALSEIQDDGVNPLRVVVSAVPVILAFIYRKKIALLQDGYINICINMSVLATFFYFFGVFTSGILVGRIPIYFDLYNLVLIPYIFKNCFNEKEKPVIYVLATIGYFMFFATYGRAGYTSDITGNIPSW